MQRHRLTFSSQVGVFALCDYYLFLGGTLTIHIATGNSIHCNGCRRGRRSTETRSSLYLLSNGPGVFIVINGV